MSAGLTVRVAQSIATIGEDAWDACANAHDAMAVATGDVQPHPEAERWNPFISYAFLHALEASGCVGGRTGWTPLHLVVSDAAGTVLGVAPAYGKGHSQGEYVFDWGWAEAFERAGGRYYPKLQIAAPFTPATGRRLLVREGAEVAAVRGALLTGARSLVDTIEGSSIHATFLGASEQAAFVEAGYIPRSDQQFHWINENYGDFDAFLAALASRKRKTIRRERRDALADDITITRLTGSDITEEAWDAYFAFYQDTGSRKWGRPYLNRAFYREIAETMADKVLLVMASRAGRYIAGAINFIGSDTLYGRNWGCIEDHPFLHFEVCYYQAIDFAIERGLARVEAGAQGEHKLARGYRPVTTHSAHYIVNPGFRRAVADYLRRERSEIDTVHEALEQAAPFRRGPRQQGHEEDE